MRNIPAVVTSLECDTEGILRELLHTLYSAWNQASPKSVSIISLFYNARLMHGLLTKECGGVSKVPGMLSWSAEKNSYFRQRTKSYYSESQMHEHVVHEVCSICTT
jgi:hypothetical protein